jgi:aconitase A
VDVLRALRRIYDRGEVHNAAVEFVGPGVASLGIEDRFKIASGVADWGAVASWFPVDGETLNYLEQRRRALARRRSHRIDESEIEEARNDPLVPDPDARYAARIHLDLAWVLPAGAEGKRPWEELRNLEPWPNGRPQEPERVEILDGFPERIRGRMVFLPVDEVDTRAICGDAGDEDDPLPETIARTVLDRVDPEFARKTGPGDVLVAGYQFGSGPSREEAATVFKAKKFLAVVAGGFAATYRRHALNNAVIAVECPDLLDRFTVAYGTDRGSGQAIVPGDEIEIDFAASRIRWRDESFRFPPFTRVPQLVVAAGGVEAMLRPGAEVA